jgi:hypothetical protein
VPPAIRDKYHLQLPPYPGTSQCVKLGPHTADSARAAAVAGGSSKAAAAAVPADMRISYDVGGLLEQHVARDPLQQFDAWFKDASACKVGQVLAAAWRGVCACVLCSTGGSAMGCVSLGSSMRHEPTCLCTEQRLCMADAK